MVRGVPDLFEGGPILGLGRGMGWVVMMIMIPLVASLWLGLRGREGSALAFRGAYSILFLYEEDR